MSRNSLLEVGTTSEGCLLPWFVKIIGHIKKLFLIGVLASHVWIYYLKFIHRYKSGISIHEPINLTPGALFLFFHKSEIHRPLGVIFSKILEKKNCFFRSRSTIYSIYYEHFTTQFPTM